MSDREYCPQCGGKIIDAPKQVYWHKNCTRCGITWFVNDKGTWEAFNSRIKIKYRRATIEKRQREYKKRHEKEIEENNELYDGFPR